jgi:hypothetical protein
MYGPPSRRKRKVRLVVVLAVLTLLYACAAVAHDEGYVPESPVVKSAEMPLYPDLARQARIQGTVRIEITTDGNIITKLTSSGAHKCFGRSGAEHTQLALLQEFTDTSRRNS